MMREALARSALCAASYGCLLLGGLVHPAIPLGCLAFLVAKTVAVDRNGLRPPGLFVPVACTALFLVWAWSVLWAPFGNDRLLLLLAFTAVGLVLCTLPPDARHKTFLVVLLSLLILLGSAAAADGLLPVAMVALYLLVSCHAFPVLARQDTRGEADARVRLLAPACRWSLAAPAVAHHVALLGLLAGAVLYLAVPRFAEADTDADAEEAASLLARRRGRVGSAGAAGAAQRAAFPSEVRVGDIGAIKGSSRIAFYATLRHEGRPFDPPPGLRNALLLRANAWDVYVPGEGRWSRQRNRVRALDEEGLLEPGDAPMDWMFSMRSYDGRALFLPQRARRIRAASSPLWIESGGIVRAQRPLASYGVEADLPVPDLAGLRPDRSDPRLLAVPAELAEPLQRHMERLRIDAGAGEVRAAVDAIRRYFEGNGFRYTLRLPADLGEDVDPLVAFLERGTGHCELYASAACLMLRLLGLPARLAGGVRCAERLGPGRYVARLRHAHAWVEVACRDVGFVPVDVTPPDTRATDDATPDRPAQEAAAEGAAGEGDAGLDLGDPFRYGRSEQRALLRAAARIVAPLLGPLAGLGLVLLAAGWVRQVAGRRARERRVLRVTAPPGVARRTLAFYARWLRHCRRAGHLRRPWQTPREFLDTLPDDLRAQGAPLTGEFERRRYGAQDAGPG